MPARMFEASVRQARDGNGPPGVALVVGLLGRARRADLRLMVCGLSEHYMEIFRITRLAEFMSVFPDEASALASMAVHTA